MPPHSVARSTVKASSGPMATVDLDDTTTGTPLLNLPGTQKTHQFKDGWMFGDFQTIFNVTKWVHQPNETTICNWMLQVHLLGITLTSGCI